MRLGYACIHTEESTCSRTVRLKNFTIQKASELALKNTESLLHLINRNVRDEIFLFRITSNLFPLVTHPKVGYYLHALPDYPQIEQNLQKVGAIADANNMRLTMHPSPYTSIISENTVTRSSSLNEIALHQTIAEIIWSKQFVINFHVGRSFSKTLVPKLKKRLEGLSKRFPVNWTLALENDDKAGGWQPEDLYPICKEMGIAYTHDFHHIKASGRTHQDVYIRWCVDSYERLGYRPKFHYSESSTDKKNPRAHSRFIENRIPVHNLDVDVMIEAKAKQEALLKYRLKYGEPYHEKVMSSSCP